MGDTQASWGTMLSLVIVAAIDRVGPIPRF